MTLPPENTSPVTPPRRLRCNCGASVHEGARFCWMCGAPVVKRQAETIFIDDDSASPTATASASRELQLAAWLALPLSVALIYGVFLYEPFYAVLFGPALLVGTLAALLHNTLTHRSHAKSPSAGRSLLLGLATFAGTFAATVAIGMVLLVIVVVSVFIAFCELCGIKLF